VTSKDILRKTNTFYAADSARVKIDGQKLLKRQVYKKICLVRQFQKSSVSPLSIFA
jgi:hypothetical protein